MAGNEIKMESALAELVEQVDTSQNEVQKLLDEGANPCAVGGDRGRTILGRAVQLGRWETIIRLIRAIPNYERPLDNVKSIVDTQDKLSRTALHYASEVGALEIMCFLIGAGSSVNVADYEGVTPLHFACSGGFENTVLCLLRCGCDVNLITAACYEHVTALHLAASKGFAKIAGHLLDFGADPDLFDIRGHTALFRAVSRQNYDVASVLLERGANPNATRVHGSRPLVEAVIRKDLHLVEILLNAGAKTHNSDFLLHQAISMRCEEIAVFLVKQGYSTTLRDPNGWTPIHLACRSGCWDVVACLLENGACANEVHHATGMTPILAAVQGSWSTKWSSFEFGALLSLLVRHGARLDQESFVPSGRNTALSLAISQRRLGVVRVILSLGSDPNLPEHRIGASLTSIYHEFGADILDLLYRAGFDFGTINLDQWRVMADDDWFPGFYECLVRFKHQPKVLRHLCSLSVRNLLLQSEGLGCLHSKIDRLRVPELLKYVLKLEN